MACATKAVAALVLIWGALWAQEHVDALNLLVNGGFEAGTDGWIPALGGYGGEPAARWEAAWGHARIVAEPVRSGRAALLLDATGLENEVDVHSTAVKVRAGYGYRLRAWVRQVAGDSIYKVTLDWRDAQGRHISYDNDWRGADRPAEFMPHGGVFVAPEGAASAVIILGVMKGVACVFDDLSLEELGPAEPVSARPRRDGDGRARIEGPTRVPARGMATWRVRYTCGDSGLPIGGAIQLRRWPLSLEWSRAQAVKADEPGYVWVSGPRGAEFELVGGNLGEVTVHLAWPSLQPGEEVEIVVGEGKGMRVQAKPGRVRWRVSSDCTGDGKFAEVEGVEGGEFEVVPGPARRAVVVAPATAEVGRPTEVAVEVRDEAENVTCHYGGSLRLVTPQGTRVESPTVTFVAGAPATRVLRIVFSRPGLQEVYVAGDASLEAPVARILVAAAVTRLAEGRGAVPCASLGDGLALLQNENVRLVFPPNPAGSAGGAEGFGYGAVYVRSGGKWRQVAALPGLGEVRWSVGEKGLREVRLFAARVEPRNECGVAELVFRGAVMTPKGARWPFVAKFGLRAGANFIETAVEVTPKTKEPLWALYGPLVCAGEGSFGSRKRSAVFPGLEFLTSEEVSSDDRGVGWGLHERWVPHPYKVTVPVMAVAGEGAVVGLMWDPLQKWDGVHQVPAARFASPNRPQRQANHYMALFVPSLLGNFQENLGRAVKPWVAPVGATLRLCADIVAMGETDDVTRALELWVKRYGLPPSEAPRTWREELALCAQGIVQTGWDADEKGWVAAIGWRPGREAHLADRLLLAATLGEDKAILAEAQRQILEAGVSGGGVEMNLRYGNPMAAVDTLRQAAYGAMQGQHPEGFWTFSQTYSMEGEKATLAAPEDVELGTCVNRLAPIMAYALATGDPKAVEAGLRGLEYCTRFVKPAGAESWEVPLVCPNLRAAALAVECYLAAYQLTRQERYLDLARYWARAGLAFIYLWAAPDRPAMPGASISVMGTTFYTHPWFGAAVQWVGLAYADALQKLARWDESLPWRRVAELITVSAMHQQKTAGAPCGHVGFYPDSYDLVRGADYYEWCLSPLGIINNVLGLVGLPTTYQVETAVDEPLRVHLSTVAAVRELRADGARAAVTARLGYLPEMSANVVVFGVSAPESVRWQGRNVAAFEYWPSQTAMDDAREGWYFDRQRQCLALRLFWQASEGELVLHGVQPLPYKPPVLPTEIANGGFEAGLDGWQVEPGGKLDTHNPHSGQAALSLACPDPAHEVQATSTPMRVEAGRRYRLTSWVWQTDGDGSYKVTIHWRGEGGQHLGYDNDWRGNDRPREWRLHGGVFVAPEGATEADIILGVRGARCLFDDISLVPEP